MDNIKTQVFKLLISDEKSKDCDNYLSYRIWENIITRKGGKMEKDFAAFYIGNKLPSFESISRVRRKYQEKYPLLRGSNYLKRQNRQRDVIKELKTI